MWCRNRSRRRFLHRKSSLSHAQLDIESYISFVSFDLSVDFTWEGFTRCDLGLPQMNISRLNLAEEAHLIFMRSEEKLARDVYLTYKSSNLSVVDGQ